MLKPQLLLNLPYNRCLQIQGRNLIKARRMEIYSLPKSPWWYFWYHPKWQFCPVYAISNPLWTRFSFHLQTNLVWFLLQGETTL